MEQAKAYKVSVPERLKNAAADYVHWTAFSETGKEYGQWGQDQWCYGAIMSHLSSLEIRCRPHPRRIIAYPPVGGIPNYRDGRLTAQQYRAFTRQLKACGLLPPEFRFFSSSQYGNCLTIPRANWDRHTVYLALCLHRWLDSRPAHLWPALLLERKFSRRAAPLPFLQALFFVLVKHSLTSNPGHSFIWMPFGIDPGTGWALASFAKLPLEERKEIRDGESRNYFSRLAKKLNPQQLFVPKAEMLLEPRFTPLFREPEKITPELFQKILREGSP